LVIKDILGVVYAPHKTFKRVAENPKYLAVAIILVLFVALQSTYYYNFSSKINYEQTLPPANKLDSFVTSNATHWVTAHDVSVRENLQDYINQTCYGNSSLQFISSGSSNRLSVSLEQFGYTANCGSDGFSILSLSIKQLSVNAAQMGDMHNPAPLIAPASGVLTLYTANDTSSYFTLDITSRLRENLGEWNNLTLPVGTSEWQSTGTPNWTEITGLQLDLTYPQSSHVNISLQGIFFRGQYLTQISALGTGMFLGFTIYSVALQIAFQWIILAILAYIFLKCLKATNVIWRPLFTVMGYTLIAIVITSALYLTLSVTLQTTYYPYDLVPYNSLLLSDALVSAASPSSQIAYEAIATATSTFSNLSTVVTIVMYALQVVFVAFAVKAVSGTQYVKNIVPSDPETPEVVNETLVSEFSIAKSVLLAVCIVLLSTVVLGFMTAIGLF